MLPDRITTKLLPPKRTGGFALLMTLIVVSVVISIGLAMLELSIKQVELSSNAAQSELAFHAANAGLECAKYWRKEKESDMEDGSTVSLPASACFGATVSWESGKNSYTILNTSDGKVYQYKYQFSWGSGLAARCTKINTVVMVADIGGNDLVLSSVDTYVPGYLRSNDETDKTCEAGAICTILSVKGYNKGCGAVTGYGVIEREVLLEY